jgi:hypothetical protein
MDHRLARSAWTGIAARDLPGILHAECSWPRSFDAIAVALQTPSVNSPENTQSQA